MIFPISFYGCPFLGALGVASIFCYLLIRIQRVYALQDQRKSARHIHKKNISRFGGVAIILSFAVVLAMNKYLVFDHIVWSMIVGGIVLLVAGIIDDIRIVGWKVQSIIQFSVITLIFAMGVRIVFITNPFGGVLWLIQDNNLLVSFIFTVIWIGIIMNVINWSDGVDGLAGGIVFIAAITIFVISIQPQVAQPPIAIISIVFAGSVLGFLIFNLPPAHVFAGSSGSFFMGFVIALLAIAAGAKIGTALLVLAVPLVDAVWVVGNRLRRGSSIFHGDRKHLHHRLLDMGWNIKKILAMYYTITILSAVIAVKTYGVNKLIALIVFVIGIVVFLIYLSNRK